MKRNLLQIITLCLCIVLLVITVIQGKRLEEYRFEMENQMQNMENSLSSQIQNISWNIQQEVEETEKMVADYEFKSRGIDAENRALLAEVSVVLKQWYADTEVTLLAAVGEEKLTLPMTADGTGGFSAEVSLPLEENFEIELNALIAGGGLTKQESLEYVGDYTMLLPLHTAGGGWSGPDYQDGILSCSYLSIDIEGRNGETVTVNHPEFHIYRNGKLAQVVPAVTPLYGDEVGSYRPNNASRGWELECEYSDIIEVFFRCEDEYGLGYDFPFQAWVVDTETDSSYVSATGISGGGDFNIFWPE